MTTDTSSVAVQPSDTSAANTDAQSPRLPLVVYVLALGTFLMLTTEFVVAGILPEMSADLGVSLPQAGMLITVFAVGMIVGAPLMAMLTLRLSQRLTLVLALAVFIIGHVIVAVGSDFTVLLATRFVTAIATGAFWAVSAVVASRAAGREAGARAIGIVGAGGALATVLGVPLGALIAQLVGWRGTFWALATAASIAIVLVARLVPADAASAASSTSIRTELAGLRSGRLWLTLAACATTSGGVLATYSFISPILTDQAGVAASLVPLVLTGFGVGSFTGTILGGRFGDARPGLVTILTPAATVFLLLGISLIAGAPWATAVLVVLLGFFGLSANGVLIHLAVRAAGRAATLGSALAVSAFNAGTAVGTTVAGEALTSPLGTSGPAVVGTVIAALTLVPTITLAVLRRRQMIDGPTRAGFSCPAPESNKEKQMNDDHEFDQIFPLGEKNDAYAQYFTGQSYLAQLVSGSVPVSNVTFEPGCRNNWHIHHGTQGGGDQILLVTGGNGWYQAEGEEPVSLEPGAVIRVPAGTKHWHGAKVDSWLSHLAFITPGEEVRNEWLEPVADEVYGELPKNGENA